MWSGECACILGPIVAKRERLIGAIPCLFTILPLGAGHENHGTEDPLREKIFEEGAIG